MNWPTNYHYIILLAIFGAKFGVLAEKASCRAAKKCCDGKDSDCLVQTSNMNSLMENYIEQEEPCYCDHGCLDVGDCCPDFKDYCGGKWLLIPNPKKHGFAITDLNRNFRGWDTILMTGLNFVQSAEKSWNHFNIL